MKKKTHVLCAVGLILVGFPWATRAQQPEEEELSPEQQLLEVMHSIESGLLYSWVDTLASPRFAGRLTGTAGFNDAATWAIEHFREWGVQPAGDNGTYLQSFPNPYTLVFPGGDLYLHVPFGDGVVEKHYVYETDYFPGSTSDSGEVTADVVYVGYGITAPELGYDDYADVDVRGKIVVYEPEVPVSPRDDAETFKKWRPYSFHQYKLENAARHGAVGLIYDYHIVNPNNAFIENFIYAAVSRGVVADIFAGTSRDHEETLEAIRAELRPRSFDTGKVFTIKTVTGHHPEGVGANVVGVVPGSDPALAGEPFLIGGHLDHLGMSHELMPGANDNASAVSVALAVAKALTRSPVRPKRPIVFILFGAEEQAVAGSRYYVEHPIYPLEATAGFINLESVGCGNVIRAGSALNYPRLWSYVERANDQYVHRIVRPSEDANLARPRQDAAWFLWEKVPTISLGVSGAPSFYHNTRDNIATITPEILEDLARIVFLAVTDLGTQEHLDFRN
jgi:hypothetical protein